MNRFTLLCEVGSISKTTCFGGNRLIYDSPRGRKSGPRLKLHNAVRKIGQQWLAALFRNQLTSSSNTGIGPRLEIATSRRYPQFVSRDS
jgi:hypothetical protein